MAEELKDAVGTVGAVGSGDDAVGGGCVRHGDGRRPEGNLMSTQVGRESRRYLFAPHVFDPARLRRCPVCQWAVEQDHAEALVMHTKRSPTLSHPSTRRAPDLDAHEELVEVGFAFA
jgi:hypothetical protein